LPPVGRLPSLAPNVPGHFQRFLFLLLVPPHDSPQPQRRRPSHARVLLTHRRPPPAAFCCRVRRDGVFSRILEARGSTFAGRLAGSRAHRRQCSAVGSAAAAHRASARVAGGCAFCRRESMPVRIMSASEAVPSRIEALENENLAVVCVCARALARVESDREGGGHKNRDRMGGGRECARDRMRRWRESQTTAPASPSFLCPQA